MSKLIEKAWTRQIEAHMRKNKIIDSNHQGRVKNRSSTNTVMQIHQTLAKLKAKNITTAIIALDQSAAFDIVSHDILKLKMLHIGLHEDTVQMFCELSKNERKQHVEVNTNKSDLLLTGPISVS